VKRWWLMIALLLSLGVNLGILATLAVDRREAPPPPVEPPPPETLEPERPDFPDEEAMARHLPRIFERMADELGLEGEPREKFIAAQRRFLEGMIRTRVQVARIQAQVRREMIAAEPDRAELERLIKELGRAHAEHENVLVANVLESRAMLGPEQQQRYLAMLARLRRMQPGHGPPPWAEGRPGERRRFPGRRGGGPFGPREEPPNNPP